MPITSTSRMTCSWRPTATSSCPKGTRRPTNARIHRVRQDRQVHQVSSGNWAPGRASSISRTPWQWIRRGGSSSATAATTGFRSSIRTATTSPSGRSSAARAGSPSTRRQHLRGRLGIGIGQHGARRLEARHPHRQHQGRQGREGARVHSRSNENATNTSAAEGVAADPAGDRVWRRGRTASAQEIREAVRINVPRDTTSDTNSEC